MNRFLLALALIPTLGLLASCGTSHAEKEKAPPIDEISMSQTTNGWGGGQFFDMTLRRDGSALLRKHKRSDEGLITQPFSGTISKKRFESVAALLEAKGFFSMKASYDSSMTDQGDTGVGAIRGGKRFAVSANGDGGPPEFYDIVQVLHAEKKAISWVEVKPAKAAKPTKKRASTATTKQCGVHHVALQNGQAPILYGLPALPAPGYFEAKSKLFPHAQSMVLGGCVIVDNAPRTQKVSFCAKCRAVETRWLAPKNAKRKS